MAPPRQSALVRISTLEHIARHVTAQEDLYSASLVNRSFQRAFSPFLWKSPILKRERSFVSFVAALRCGSQNGRHVRVLFLVVRDSTSRRDFHPFVRSTQECHRKASKSVFASADNILLITKHCPGLQSLTCYGWNLDAHDLETIVLDVTQLQHFVLIGSNSQAYDLADTVAEIPSILPNLKTFHLDGQFYHTAQFTQSLGRHGRSIECLKFSSSAFGTLDKGLTSLTSLELFDCPNITDDDIDDLIQHCTMVTSIALTDCPTLSVLTLKRLLESRLRLKCLDFRIAPRMTGVRDVPKHFSITIPDGLDLRELFLHNVGFTNQQYADILYALPRLKRLGLSRCFQLTARLLVDALQSFYALESLHLIECPLIGETALKQVAEHHIKTLNSLVIDTCGPMHIRSVVHIVKQCLQLQRFGVHGYPHISNSPYHRHSTEAKSPRLRRRRRRRRSLATLDAMCSTTFELENLDKLIEHYESPQSSEEEEDVPEEASVIKSGEESDIDNSSTFSSSDPDESDDDFTAFPPLSALLAAGILRNSGNNNDHKAFQFEYDTAASAYDLAKQVVEADSNAASIELDDWATDAVDESEPPTASIFHEISSPTFSPEISSSGASCPTSTSQHPHRRSFEFRPPRSRGSAFPRRPFVPRASFGPNLPSSSSSFKTSSSQTGHWQVFSRELQYGRGHPGTIIMAPTAQYVNETATWLNDQDSPVKELLPIPADQRTNLRGGWGEQPRHPQVYTDESIKQASCPPVDKNEKSETFMYIDMQAEALKRSMEDWVDYSQWIKTSRGVNVEQQQQEERVLNGQAAGQNQEPHSTHILFTFTPDQTVQEMPLSLSSSSSQLPSTKCAVENEAVHAETPSQLVDIFDHPSTEDDATKGMGGAFDDIRELGVYFSEQVPRKEMNHDNETRSTAGQSKSAKVQETRMDLLTGEIDVPDVAVASTPTLSMHPSSMPRNPHTPIETDIVEDTSLALSSAYGLTNSDSAASSAPPTLFTMHTVALSSPLPVEGSMSSAIPLSPKSNVLAAFPTSAIILDDPTPNITTSTTTPTPTLIAIPKPSVATNSLARSSSSKPEKFEFDFGDAKSWLQELSQRQKSR